ncbi:hypothetical protein AB0M54_10780 [Actinoplanes sp. NPDC051470]|uniref:hypothetical protein n=1 Tax=unclassified Actinoplanes TaxID=2626549 RepID=UPI003447707E
MGETLIDLGMVTRTVRVAAAPDPLRLRRPLGALIALILVALCTGAAHREPPPPPRVVAAGLGDMTFVSADRLFVVEAGPFPPGAPATDRVINEYALPAGRLISRTTASVTGAIISVLAAGPLILISYQVDSLDTDATVALEAGTHRALWRRPARLLSMSPDDGIVLLRENNPRPGPRAWYGVDLATGNLRWTVEEPRRGFTVASGLGPGGFPAMLVSATDTGELSVRDTRTGDLTARATTRVRDRPAGADVPIWPAGDLVLVGEPRGTTAYRLPGLSEAWHSDVDLSGRWVQNDCDTGICSLSWQGGLWWLDRETGVRRWIADRWNYADQAGHYLLATGNEPGERGRVVSVLDPDTGQVRGDFGRWHSVGAADADGMVVGLREHLIDDTVYYARLDPATMRIHVLGTADHVSGDCHTTIEVLVCRRIDASVGLWSLK